MGTKTVRFTNHISKLELQYNKKTSFQFISKLRFGMISLRSYDYLVNRPQDQTDSAK